MIPQLTDLREEILREFHCSRFAVHPGSMKKYHDLRRQYLAMWMTFTLEEFYRLYI